MKRIARSLLAVWCAGGAIAHAGTVSVMVIDKDGKPVVNAVVLVTSPKAGVLTVPADKVDATIERIRTASYTTIISIDNVRTHTQARPSMRNPR